MKRFFIGIDFSKLKFDVALIDGKRKIVIGCNVFDNDARGCRQLLQWVKERVGSEAGGWLFCGEHTGIYTRTLGEFLSSGGYDLWLEPGLQIKLSKGMARGKTDRVDAESIAQYASRHQDKFRRHQSDPDGLDALKDLMAYRGRLVKAKKLFAVSSKELCGVSGNAGARAHISDGSDEIVATMRARIDAVEAEILALIWGDEDLAKTYRLLTSIKGIALVNAVLTIITTRNFILFKTPRQYGSYCGVVPFAHRSGTSVCKKDRVSHLANKRVKAALTQAARTAVMHDPQLRAYYQRKVAEGKHDSLILNNVKNKLIHRMFALVRSGKEYVVNFQHPLRSAA